VTDGVAFMIASRARYEDATTRQRTAPPVDLFVEDLLAITCAALEAPMGPEAAGLAGPSVRASRKGLQA
jgi:hypothetical protein